MYIPTNIRIQGRAKEQLAKAPGTNPGEATYGKTQKAWKTKTRQGRERLGNEKDRSKIKMDHGRPTGKVRKCLDLPRKIQEDLGKSGVIPRNN